MRSRARSWRRFGGDDPDLVVCFASPHFVGAMDDLAFALGNLLSPRVLMGATAVAIVGGAARGRGRSRARRCSRRRCPAPALTPVSLARRADARRRARSSGWPELDHDRPRCSCSPIRSPSRPTAFLAADARPTTVTADPRTGLQVIGGAASAARGPGGNRLVLDGAGHARRARSACSSTGSPCGTVVSQGCRPVGQPVCDHPRRAATGSRSWPASPRSSACRSARRGVARRTAC